MSMSGEGTGLQMKPTTHPESDKSDNQAQSQGTETPSTQAAAPEARQGGLPGLAGFAQTNTFAAPPAPQPSAPPPAAQPSAPVFESQPLAEPAQPVEPEAPAFSERPEPPIEQFQAEPAPVEPPSMEAPAPGPTSFDAAPVDAAPIESAPVEAAPIESSPFDSAFLEPAPVESAPAEAAPIESPFLEPAPVEPAPSEASSIDASPFDAAAFEAAPLEDAQFDPGPIEAAHFEAPAVEAAPIEPPAAEVFPGDPTHIEPEAMETQIPSYIAPQEPAGGAVAADIPDLNALSDPAVPETPAAGLPADDDFDAFSAEALERYFAGEGDIPGGESGLLADESGLGQPEFGLDAPDSNFGVDTPIGVDNPIGADAPMETPEVPDLSTGVQPFEARYDQHPELELGDFQEGVHPGSYQTEAENLTPPDADFLEGETIEPEVAAVAKTPKSRSMIMVSTALVTSLVLGGALAYVYGDFFSGDSDDNPLIKADNAPTKVEPEDPGGRKFAHKNKQIYDRLQGDETPEVAKIVPRQEQVASNAAPAAPAAPAAGNTQPSADGPKKVQTLTVRPDGTVVQSQGAPAAAGTQVAAANPQQAAPTPPPVVQNLPPAPAPQQATPAVPPPGTPATMSAPNRRPILDNASNQTAALSTAAQPVAAPAPTVGGEQFVVQVAARRSQTEALAAFADLQQRYPSLLNSYRPIIQRADLGDKGVWYRLRVGPMTEKTAAATLCQKLKSAGMPSCLVRPHTGS